MYAQINEKVETELDGLVKKSLGDGWQKKTAKVLEDAMETVTRDIADYIGTELEDHLAEHVRNAARNIAEDFLERLANGDEQAVQQFLKLPHDYWPQRERWTWTDYGKDYEPIELRRRMIEAVQDRLEREVILDQEAQIKKLVEKVQAQEAELIRWRTGNLVRD